MSIEQTIPLIFQARVKKWPDIIVQAFKNGSDTFEKRTYKDLYEKVLDFAQALRELGVKRNDLVGLISDNRQEWLISDLAIQCLGAADVPRGCDSMEKEIAFILSTTSCTISFIENKSQLTKILNSRQSIPLLKTLIMFNTPSQEDLILAKEKNLELLSFENLATKGKQTRAASLDTITAELEAEIEKGRGEELATVIFTSGTTGEPKGVMLTQSNYTWQLERIPSILQVYPSDMWLTILPVWHSFERLMQYIIIERASGMAYSKPVASVMLPDIAKIKPQILPGVPRLWEGLAAGIFRTIKKEGGIKKHMFMFFVGVGKKYVLSRDLVLGRLPRFTKRNKLIDFLTGILPFLVLYPIQALGDVLVYKKVRSKLGGRIRVCISGGGALPSDVDLFYRAIGLNMLEGYGITETAPLLSLRDQYKPRPNCVGNVFIDTDCKIVNIDELTRVVKEASEVPTDLNEDLASPTSKTVVRGSWTSPPALKAGESGVIMVRGGQLMKGYYKRPDLTRQVIDKDGWFNTGDLGMISLDNEIKITGRAKDTIVLLGGENVEPFPIEQAIKTFECIDTVVVLGQDQKYLACLIVPAKDALISWATDADLDTEDYDALLENPLTVQLFRSAIDSRVNHQNGFRPFETIFRFVLLKDTFQVGKELSGKQELMRHRILDIYKKEIADLF